MVVPHGKSKVQCSKEQDCIGTWDIRSTNQCKLNAVKQYTAGLNIDISGSGELKWMEMGEFNSDNHYNYYCGLESFGRNGVAFRVIKRVQNAVLGCTLKNNTMISVYFQGKSFNITTIQVYDPTTDAKEAELDQFYEDDNTF